MKILQIKISNPISYLLLLFTGASVVMLFYGQFSNLEFETLNMIDQNPSPVVKVAPLLQESTELSDTNVQETRGDMILPVTQ